MNDTYHIACCTDNNYAQHCGVMLCSLLENNKDNHFCIHILHTDLNNDNQRKLSSIVVENYHSEVRFYLMDEKKFTHIKMPQNTSLSIATYYRFTLGSLLSNEIKTILYLDCDLVVLRPISDLFNLDMDNYALAAVEDYCIVDNHHRMQLALSYQSPYFNAGVLFINLEYWRKHSVENKLFQYIGFCKIDYFQDQDALNYVFKDKWLQLSPIWNKINMQAIKGSVFKYSSDKKEYYHNPVIIHYAWGAIKPWLNIHFLPNSAFYHTYLKKTPWAKVKVQSIKSNGIYFVLLKRFIKIFVYRFFK